MREPEKRSKVSGHAIAALYLSIVALILPVATAGFVSLKPAAEVYLDFHHADNTLLLALQSLISIVLALASISLGEIGRNRIG